MEFVYDGRTNVLMRYPKEFDNTKHFKRVLKWFNENKQDILKKASYPYNIDIATQIKEHFRVGLTQADLFTLTYNI